MRRRRSSAETGTDALKHLGYRPVIADDGAGASGLLLKCKVDKFWFNNYTWPVIFPFVPTWGDVGDGDLGLASGDATVEQELQRERLHREPLSGYSGAVRQSMNEILAQMVKE